MKSPFNEQVYLDLPKESQDKVYLIYHIADGLRSLGVSEITSDDFDYLYDKPITVLEEMAGVAARLNEPDLRPYIKAKKR